MIVQPTFYVPADIAAGLLSGDFIRFGGVVRDTGGRLVKHLDEVPTLKPSEEAKAAAVSLLKKPAVLITTAVVGLAVAGATAAVVVISRRRKRAMPEYVKNYNSALHAYLEAVRNQTLDAEAIDRLIAALDAVKEHSETGDITVDFSTEQSETLVRLVLDYAKQLAEANLVDLNASQELVSVSEGDNVVDLRRYLEVQRQILEAA